VRTFSSTKPPSKVTRASILVHGLTGGGKTTRALRDGKPLVICTEPKAEAHILNLNPSATCWIPESCKDLTDIMEWLGNPKLLDQGFTRIVLDSATELTELLPDWILQKQAADVTIEMGRRISIEEYRPITSWVIGILRAIQLSGLPSIIIARSDAKKIGLIEKIVPAGLGSSCRNLNAQLVPTVESRYDSEILDFVWDSRPDEYSQRCGLLWVPPIFRGTADEFLACVEQGAQSATPNPNTNTNTTTATATATHGTATPAATVEKAPELSPSDKAGAPQAQGATTAPVNPLLTPEAALAVLEREKAGNPLPTVYNKEWEDALIAFNEASFKAGWSAEERKRFYDDFQAMGPQALERVQAVTKNLLPEPTTVGAVLNQLPPQAASAVSPKAENFVDEVDKGVVFVNEDELATLKGILTANKIDQAAFLRYCDAEKHVMPADKGEIRLDRMVRKAYEKLLPILQSERRRGSLVAFIVNKFPTNNAA